MPTPLREGAPDLTLHRGGRRVAGAHLRPGATVILESTTYPGTTEELVAPILEAVSGLDGRRRLPPRLQPRAHRPGQPDLDLRDHAEGRLGRRRGVAGRGAGASTTARRHDRPGRLDPKEAELTKLLENTFRHVNIALVNELAMFAHDLGIDVWEAIDAAATEAVRLHEVHARPRRRRPLPADRPVLPVVAGEAHRSGQPFRFVELANDVNEHMPDYVVRRVITALNRRSLPVRGTPRPAARPVVQEEHRRRTRVARDPDCRVARLARRRPSRLRSSGCGKPGLGIVHAG